MRFLLIPWRWWRSLENSMRVIQYRGLSQFLYLLGFLKEGKEIKTLHKLLITVGLILILSFICNNAFT
jgi:hypothetical protein